VGDLTNPSPVLEVAIGTIGLVIVMFFHGTGVRFINKHYSTAWVRLDPSTPHWGVNLLLALVISAFTIVHLVETLIWAVPIHRLGMIPSLRDSYYYVLESYTTLGEGAVSLPEKWQLIGPIIAMSGLFTFGWTGSVLVGIMTEFSQLDRSRARRKQAAEQAADAAAEPETRS
jgi:hypothetical protein